jgi:hypothetical protein
MKRRVYKLTVVAHPLIAASRASRATGLAVYYNYQPL